MGQQLFPKTNKRHVSLLTPKVTGAAPPLVSYSHRDPGVSRAKALGSWEGGRQARLQTVFPRASKFKLQLLVYLFRQ